LLLTNGPGAISAQGAKGAVSADGPETPGRVQLNSIRPRIPVVESAADFVETPVPSGRVFGGGADSCIRVNIAHC